MNTTTTVGKRYPQKPVKQVPVEITKEACQEDARRCKDMQKRVKVGI